MIDISITIVAYNNEADVRDAVRSMMEHTNGRMSKKIYIVDNSTEANQLSSLAEEYEDVVYQRPGGNLGFGGGHNYVLPELDSQYHAIVNPDILLTEDSFSVLLSFLKQSKAGMAVPKLLDEQGKMQAVYRRDLTVFDMAVSPLIFIRDNITIRCRIWIMGSRFPFPLPRAVFSSFAQSCFGSWEDLTNVISCIWKMRTFVSG